MSATEGLKIGKVIYNILSNDSTTTSVTGMSAAKIQPAPLKEQANPDVCVTYEIDAVNPINIKYSGALITAPIYIVDFSCECVSRDYSTGIILADAVAKALQEAANGTYNSVKLNGLTLSSATEDYNKARRYYSKRLSFQARILL